MSSSPALPVEVIELIISYICDDKSYLPIDEYNSAEVRFLSQQSVVNLLRLRLLGRTWAATIQEIIYKSLHLTFPYTRSYLKRMSNINSAATYMSRPCQLTLDRVMYRGEIGPGTFYDRIKDPKLKELELEYQHYSTKSTNMQDAASLIALCGATLTDLKISFTHSVGFSRELSAAIGQIKNLKSLSIDGDKFHNINNDSDSLVAVLNTTDALESLSLDFATLTSLELKSGALAKLEHLWVGNHLMNINAVNNFCETGGRSIKVLEYTPTSDETSSERLMLALKLTLQVLFMDMLPKYIPKNLRMAQFPKLRVLRSEYVNHLRDYPEWAGWTIFQNVEVFITPYRRGNTHWRNEMKEIAKLPMPPNLLHFVFIVEKDYVIQREELVREFGKQDISCHFATSSTYRDLLVSSLSFLLRVLTYANVAFVNFPLSEIGEGTRARLTRGSR